MGLCAIFISQCVCIEVQIFEEFSAKLLSVVGENGLRIPYANARFQVNALATSNARSLASRVFSSFSVVVPRVLRRDIASACVLRDPFMFGISKSNSSSRILHRMSLPLESAISNNHLRHARVDCSKPETFRPPLTI
eukprot:IDg7074t1